LNYKRLLITIVSDEGFRESPYQDTVLKKWTIGFGTTYIDGKPVTGSTRKMSRSKATAILKSDVYEACVNAQNIFVNLNDIGSVRAEVLVNMTYNIGWGGMGSFVKLKAAVNAMDFSEAALQIEDSLYFNQVGDRARRLVDRMRTGCN
jgi:lysozyme